MVRPISPNLTPLHTVPRHHDSSLLYRREYNHQSLQQQPLPLPLPLPLHSHFEQPVNSEEPNQPASPSPATKPVKSSKNNKHYFNRYKKYKYSRNADQHPRQHRNFDAKYRSVPPNSAVKNKATPNVSRYNPPPPTGRPSGRRPRGRPIQRDLDKRPNGNGPSKGSSSGWYDAVAACKKNGNVTNDENNSTKRRRQDLNDMNSNKKNKVSCSKEDEMDSNNELELVRKNKNDYLLIIQEQQAATTKPFHILLSAPVDKNPNDKLQQHQEQQDTTTNFIHIPTSAPVEEITKVHIGLKHKETNPINKSIDADESSSKQKYGVTALTKNMEDKKDNKQVQQGSNVVKSSKNIEVECSHDDNDAHGKFKHVDKNNNKENSNCNNINLSCKRQLSPILMPVHSEQLTAQPNIHSPKRPANYKRTTKSGPEADVSDITPTDNNKNNAKTINRKFKTEATIKITAQVGEREEDGDDEKQKKAKEEEQQRLTRTLQELGLLDSREVQGHGRERNKIKAEIELINHNEMFKKEIVDEDLGNVLLHDSASSFDDIPLAEQQQLIQKHDQKDRQEKKSHVDEGEEKSYTKIDCLKKKRNDVGQDDAKPFDKLVKAVALQKRRENNQKNDKKEGYSKRNLKSEFHSHNFKKYNYSNQGTQKQPQVEREGKDNSFIEENLNSTQIIDITFLGEGTNATRLPPQQKELNTANKKSMLPLPTCQPQERDPFTIEEEDKMEIETEDKDKSKDKDGDEDEDEDEERMKSRTIPELSRMLSSTNDTTVKKQTLLEFVRRAEETGRERELNDERHVHLRYLDEFCKFMDMNKDELKEMIILKSEQEQGDDNDNDNDKKQRIISHFIAFILYQPIDTSNKVGGGRKINETKTNSIEYALQVMSTIQQTYGKDDNISFENEVTSNVKLKRIIKGFRKILPQNKHNSNTNTTKTGVMYDHMIAIKKQLDLNRSQNDRVLWALWTTQWQGVVRSGDLIRGKDEDVKNKWDCKLDMHIGRLSFERIHETEEDESIEQDEKCRVKLKMKPSKNNGYREFMKTFIIDDHEDAVCAGYALWQMYEYENQYGQRGGDEDMSQIPLFKDSNTGKEISYETSQNRLKECLIQAGLKDLAQKKLSLRLGGATTYAQSGAGGELVAGFMDIWALQQKWGHDRLESAAKVIGRQTTLK